MNKRNEKIDLDNLDIDNAKEAYQTLFNWAKSVPDTIREIEQNGTEQDLIQYKKKVKMVLNKLENIQSDLNK